MFQHWRGLMTRLSPAADEEHYYGDSKGGESRNLHCRHRAFEFPVGPEFDEYAHAWAAAQQILMTADTAPLAEAIKCLAAAAAACVADAIRILAQVTPAAAAMGAQPWAQ